MTCGNSNTGGARDLGWGELERDEANRLISAAILEDAPAGDITSEALFPAGGPGVALNFVSREIGILCGLPIVEQLFRSLHSGIGAGPSTRGGRRARDGDRIEPGISLFRVEGPALSVLRGERIALNFLQRLSGIATTTSRWVAEIADLPCVLLDTRKTTPGWRQLEKYAVRAGGAQNHRRDLSDGFMLKDNHAWILRESGCQEPADWVRAMRNYRPGVFLELEVDSRDEFEQVRGLDVDAILLDNFDCADLRWAVARNLERGSPRPLLEASGGIQMSQLRDVAVTGVDRISSGALTHSFQSLDIGLDSELSSRKPT